MWTTRLLRTTTSLILAVALLCVVPAIKARDFYLLTYAPAQQKQGPTKKILTAEDFAKNRAERGSGREEVTFIIEINPSLPPFVFRLIPDRTAKFNIGQVNYQHVGTIEIFRQGTGGAFQTIEVESHIPNLSWFAEYFKVLDINFDGYLDIAVTSDFGAKWMSYHYWQFDPGSGRFITNKLMRQLGKLTPMNRIELDPKRRTIHLRYLVNDQARIGETYQVENEQIVLIETEERHKDCDGKFQQLTVKIINGKREGKDLITLEPCKQITQNIAVGETHRYQVRLDAGQHLRVDIDGSIDLVLALFGTDGKRLVVAGDLEAGDHQVISWEAEASGIYRLEVHPLKEDTAGLYNIRMEQPRSVPR